MNWTKRILAFSLTVSLAISGILLVDRPVQAAQKVDFAAWGNQVVKTFTVFQEENKDPYAMYYTPEEYNTMLESVLGTFAGVGAYMTTNPESGATVIVSPIKNTPAFKAGLQAGDVIVAVNGEDVQNQDSDYIVSLIRGKAGTKVDLTVSREGVGEITFHLKREMITEPSMEGHLIEGHPQIGYIYISNFTEQTGEEFTDVWRELNQNGPIEGLILDLRYNPGGSLYGAVDFINHFLPADSVEVTLKGKDTQDDYLAVKGDKIEVPIVLLQNGDSASASEVTIGALKDHNRAISVGTTSFGKGIVQSLVGLKSGAGFKSTDARYFTPSGHDIHGAGIEPDYEVAWDESVPAIAIFDLDVKVDAQLAKAIALLEATK